jgi:elongator complex protein 1
VGAVQEGILAMSWSPDQELVIFATGNDTVLAMSKDWEMLFENPIDLIPPKQQKAGTTTKAVQQPITKQPTKICWRADGKFFVVISTDASDGKQWIRIWERSGGLFARNETTVTGLLSSVHWRPDGSIIAVPQYLANKNETNIAFFEKNGLQHYEFLLEKGGASQVRSLQWNADSDVLAVHFVPHSQTQIEVVQLWYRGNYHWYLKQELRFDAQSAPTFVTWDNNISLRLHVMCNNGTYQCYDFCWDHTISSGNDKSNPCTCVVIDTKKLLFTPFRYAVVPPPMSAASLDCSKAVSNISFSPSKNLLVQYSDGSIEFLGMTTDPKPPKFGLPPKLISVLDFGDHKLANLRLVTFVNDNTIYAAEASEVAQGDNLVIIKIADFAKITEVTRYPYPQKILRIAVNSFTGHVFVQTQGGALYIQSADKEPQENAESFDHPCPVFAPCHMADEEVVVGLTSRGVLYLNSNVASSNCSSFALHDQFLLFTTFSNQLRVVPLSIPVHEALDLASASPSSKNDDSYRELERGSKLVCAVPSDIRVVLQMPRGNLEGIYPRAIVLAYIRKLLNEQNYREAVVISRKYKIDMNLIFDHNPQLFLNNTEDFVRKVNDTDLINLFLAALGNSDITETRYPGYFTSEEKLESSKTNRKDLIANKINSVCDTMRESLKKVDEKKFIPSIIMTFAKHDPPMLEEALTLVRTLGSASEQALTYLIFLADVNKLYDIALGMYDFDLVLMVAQKSQKDPREYLPFIANLQKLEKYYQRYSIDIHLERYESALKNLALAGPQYIEECLKLIKQRSLYTLGIQLFKDDKERLKAVFSLYADHLMANKNYKQAAVAYLQAEQLTQALEAYKFAGEYKYAFALAKQLKYSKEQTKALAKQMLEILDSMNKTKKKAIVLRDYLEDDEEAILTLLRGDLWDDVLRFAALSDRLDLIQTHIKPHAYDGYRDRLNDLQESERKIQKYVKRLQELRQEKQRILREMEDEENQRPDDTFSDTMSLQSQSTSYSGVSVFSKASVKTNMSRRHIPRNQKRKYKLKKGSPYEEQNIVSRIESLLPSVKVQTQIGQLLQALIYFGYYYEAKEVQNQLKSVIQVSLANAAEIELPFTPLTVEGDPEPVTIYPKKVSEVIGTVNWKLTILE